MTYAAANLALMSSANGFKHYRYDTLDAATAVDGSGYFDDASGQLNIGDLITSFDWTTAIRTGTIADVSMHVVVSNSSGVVDLSNDLLSATVTDSD